MYKCCDCNISVNKIFKDFYPFCPECYDDYIFILKKKKAVRKLNKNNQWQDAVSIRLITCLYLLCGLNRNAIFARIHAILHKIKNPKHKIIWRYHADEICNGDIVCNTCNRVFWCRWYDYPTKIKWKLYEYMKAKNIVGGINSE